MSGEANEFAGALVFVIDDNDVARTVLLRMLESAGYRTEAFTSAEDFLARAELSRGECVVTDVHMQGMTGVELQQRLAATSSTLPVIVITGFPSTSLAVRAMQQGAASFLPKPYRAEELLAAVADALDRSRRADDRDRRRQDVAAMFAKLQEGDLAVLELLAAGQSNKAIARRLDVSLRTIEGRRRRIFEALDVASVAEAVRLHLEHKA